MSLQFYQKQLEKIIRENQIYIRRYQDIFNTQRNHIQSLVQLFGKLFPSIQKLNVQYSETNFKNSELILKYYSDEVYKWKQMHFNSTIQLIFGQNTQNNQSQSYQLKQKVIRQCDWIKNQPTFYESLKKLCKRQLQEKNIQVKQLQEQIDECQERQEKYLTKIQNLKQMIRQLQYQLNSNQLVNQKLKKYYETANTRQNDQIQQLKRKIQKYILQQKNKETRSNYKMEEKTQNETKNMISVYLNDKSEKQFHQSTVFGQIQHNTQINDHQHQHQRSQLKWFDPQQTQAFEMKRSCQFKNQFKQQGKKAQTIDFYKKKESKVESSNKGDKKKSLPW